MTKDNFEEREKTLEINHRNERLNKDLKMSGKCHREFNKGVQIYPVD